MRDLHDTLPSGEPAVSLEDICDIHDVMIAAAVNAERARKHEEKVRGKGSR